MTFSEALKANETSAVKDPREVTWYVGALDIRLGLKEVMTIHRELLTGTWTLVREPRVIWVYEYGTNVSGEFFTGNFDGSGRVKFVEVLDEG